MLPKIASTALMAGALLMALAPAAFARDHDRSEGRHGNFSGRSERNRNDERGFSGGHFSGGQRFASPRFDSPRRYDGRRGYSGGPSYYGRGYVGGYIAPRSYGRPIYRGYNPRFNPGFSGGVYLGYSAPYGYAYDPGYSSAPAPQACSPGSYDRYGNWVPNPDCYTDDQQYQPQQQNYDPNQQQYQQPQQDYDYNQQQNYDRNPPPPYDR